MSNSQGSAILIVILFMSILSIFCVSFWQSSSLFHDISLQRLAYEQRYRIAEGGLNYAIVFCRKHFDAILEACRETGQTYQIDTGSWRVAQQIAYQCNVMVAFAGGALHMQSVVCDENKKNIFRLSCHLVKDVRDKEKERFLIKHWSIGE